MGRALGLVERGGGAEADRRHLRAGAGGLVERQRRRAPGAGHVDQREVRPVVAPHPDDGEAPHPVLAPARVGLADADPPPDAQRPRVVGGDPGGRRVVVRVGGVLAVGEVLLVDESRDRRVVGRRDMPRGQVGRRRRPRPRCRSPGRSAPGAGAPRGRRPS